MATKNEIETMFLNNNHTFIKNMQTDKITKEIEELSKKVVEYICTHSHVTFAEIQDIFKENGFKYNGNYEICPYNNVVFWSGWNNAALDVLCYSFKSGKIGFAPCTCYIGGLPFTYLTTGAVLQLPILTDRSAKRAIEGTLKSRHWLPIEFMSKKDWVVFVKKQKGTYQLV